MKDICCLAAALIDLFSPTVLVILWYKKTGARFFPAIAAFLVCFPVFFVGNAIRSGFDHSNFIAFYIQQGLLFGVFEEGTKYLMMRYFLTSYDNRKDAVTYSIGHAAYEGLGSGISCIGLIGTDKASTDILFFHIWGVVTGAISCAAVAVIIFYGIQKGKSIVTLPAVILAHAFMNSSHGIFIDSFGTILRAVLMAGIYFVGYRCWKSLRSPFEEMSET
jgi:uncharacterized membrane protein YhfC